MIPLKLRSRVLNLPSQEKYPKMAAPIKWMILFIVVVIGTAEAAPKFNVSPVSSQLCSFLNDAVY